MWASPPCRSQTRWFRSDSSEGMVAPPGSIIKYRSYSVCRLETPCVRILEAAVLTGRPACLPNLVRPVRWAWNPKDDDADKQAAERQHLQEGDDAFGRVVGDGHE